MKQERIIKFKLWDALQNNRNFVVFPVEFYTYKEVEQGLNTFDKNHVKTEITEGKTDKGFDAYIVEINRIEKSELTIKE